VTPETKDDEYAHSAGELLRGTRESKKLSLADVQRETRMSSQVLKALEQDDFAAFESDIYLKGFLKSYAKYLGLDPEEVSRRLDRQRGAGAASKGTTWDIEETIHEEKLKSPRILTRIVLPVLVLVIAVLIVLLALERRKVQELQSDLRQVGRTAELLDQRSA